MDFDKEGEMIFSKCDFSDHDDDYGGNGETGFFIIKSSSLAHCLFAYKLITMLCILM